MKTANTVACVLIILLGTVHIGFTFKNYDGVSFDAAWFLGTGVAIVLSGFLNVAMIRNGGKDTLVWTLTLLTNIFFLVGFAAATYMMREPQVFIGTVLFAVTSFYSFTISPAKD